MTPAPIEVAAQEDVDAPAAPAQTATEAGTEAVIHMGTVRNPPLPSLSCPYTLSDPLETLLVTIHLT
ncbi:hypothetical protein E1B28_001882 [Marasmius oreades]|uniref:Uncharacterized protein n=1 Tax=Marasmius oreades TaxID=181124 RepID=A0A9P7V4N8_9AGAR|nr:uncharacterized protein E1B28_001882 [Marasmius oreades]KAG7100102.1 hypothetical protein E1B28_001882 [Marasmius oreades]